MKYLFLPGVFIIISTFKLSAQVDSTNADRQLLTADSTFSKADTTIDSTKSFLGNFWGHDPHSVKQAAIFSAVIPGLGQAYNEKYWKIPIVYAALGTSAYFVYGNSVAYRDLRNAYILRTDDDSTTSDEYVNVFGTQQYTGYLSDTYLLDYVDQWKRYTDINWIILSFIYMLNIVDAVVDAHLYDFDVSNDLSMQADPFFIPRNNYSNTMNSISGYAGLNIKINLK